MPFPRINGIPWMAVARPKAVTAPASEDIATFQFHANNDP